MNLSPRLGLPMFEDLCTHEKRCKSRGTYRMVGSCANCSSKVVGVFTLGHEARSGWNSPSCPICQCSGKLYWKGLEDSVEFEPPMTPGAAAKIRQEMNELD